ncbi:MAG TPA: VOC family protein, partial [bacterium]|nr:VOC family protein [bacterium]
MPAYLEHANITVPDIDAAIAFLTTAFPEFQVRHDSGPRPGDEIRWVHVGT